jgi:hypothetical protein
MRHLYRHCGDHIAWRAAHEYQYDPRDLGPDGEPKPGLLRRAPRIEPVEDELEFDHQLTDEEKAKHFSALVKKDEPGK